MMLINIDPWAVLVAGVLAYLVGWAWYSPVLWQRPWMEARGDTGENWEMEGKKEMPRIMVYGIVNTLLMAFVVSVFFALTDAKTLIEHLQVALLLCFGFVVTVKFNDLLYTPTPPHWGKRAQTIFLVDTGYQIALFIVIATAVWFFTK